MFCVASGPAGLRWDPGPGWLPGRRPAGGLPDNAHQPPARGVPSPADHRTAGRRRPGRTTARGQAASRVITRAITPGEPSSHHLTDTRCLGRGTTVAARALGRQPLRAGGPALQRRRDRAGAAHLRHRVSWFPHISPTGDVAVYLSYPTGHHRARRRPTRGTSAPLGRRLAPTHDSGRTRRRARHDQRAQLGPGRVGVRVRRLPHRPVADAAPSSSVRVSRVLLCRSGHRRAALGPAGRRAPRRLFTHAT